MNLTEQCQKLVDSVSSKPNSELILPRPAPVLTHAEVMEKIDSNLFSSEALDDVIKKSKKVLFIIHKDATNTSIRETLASILVKLSGVDFSLILACDGAYCVSVVDYKAILGEELYLHYADRVIVYSPSQIEDFDFFGKTKQNTPIFLHKSYLQHDTVIILSSVRYNFMLGFSGGKSLIFPGIAAAKSAAKLVTLAYDVEKRKKSDNVYAGKAAGNPLFTDLTDAAMIASSKNRWFGINLVTDINEGIIDVTSGDLFLSHLEAINILNKFFAHEVKEKFDGVILMTDVTTVFDLAREIDAATRALKKGCRLVAVAPKVNSFGSDNFTSIFYDSNIDKMFDDNLIYPSIAKVAALILKSACKQYHIAVISDANIEDIVQVGFNPIDFEDVQEFLKNSNKVGILKDVSRFTAI